MSAAALELLSRYEFPGNVRELEHAVSGAVIFSDQGVVEIEHLPEGIRSFVAEARPDLHARIVTNGESFWTVVREPYLRRQLPAADVRQLVRRARDEGGGTVRGMARVLGVDAEYRKLLDFLRNHGLLE